MKKSIEINVVDMLDFLGVNDVERDGKEIWFQCPFAGHKPGSGNRNASFRRADDHPWWVFNCFVCGERGTSIEFWSKHQGVHRELAKMALQERYGSSFIDPGDSLGDEVARMLAGAEEHRKRPIVPLDEKHVEERSVDWQDLGVAFANGEELPDALTYMFRRGFSADTLDEWEVGYDTILEMISIPWRNPAGELIAFKGRAWWPNAKPKYRMLGNKEGREDRYEFDTIDISQTLYGLWKVEAGLGRVILCEGELNNIAMWQFGYHNVLGLSGQFLSETQAIILAGIADEVVLLFDEEEKALRAAELLEGSVRVWIVPERDGDPADSCEAEVEEWLDGLVDPLLVQCGL